MKVTEVINKEYQDLCKTLGDLTLRKQQVEEKIEDTKDKITSLLELAQKIPAYEALIKSEVENERSKCPSCSCDSGLSTDKSGTDGQD